MANQSGIPNISTVNIIVQRLKNLFEVEKIYLQPDLSLTTLSKLVGTNNSYLSKVINQEFGKNFSTLINFYRIEHAKKLMRSQIVRINQLPNLCGFKARSSFYAAFEAITGESPTAFMKSDKSLE